jgi:glycosyltransferase involved in cell wall biosynthesis
MTDKPLVSVIIPSYNRINKIGAAIESAANQTYKNIQLIVSDDGSTDGTENFIKSNYPYVNYILGVHGGQASARNNGLSLSKGSIVASLDSDDQWAPEFLERCVTKLEADNLDFVFTNWHQQDVNGSYSDFLLRDPYLRPFVKENVQWRHLSPGELRSLYLKECPSPSSSAVLRRSSIVSGWNDRMKVGDDWCLFLDIILSKNCNVAFTMDKLWHKHINFNNVYDGRKRNELLEFFYIADTIEIMERFHSRLTADELAYLNKKCTRAFVELAKHHIIRDFNLVKFARLMGRSVQLSWHNTLVAIPDVVFFGMDRHFRELWGKVLKKRYVSN